MIEMDGGCGLTGRGPREHSRVIEMVYVCVGVVVTRMHNLSDPDLHTENGAILLYGNYTPNL